MPRVRFRHVVLDNLLGRQLLNNAIVSSHLVLDLVRAVAYDECLAVLQFFLRWSLEVFRIVELPALVVVYQLAQEQKLLHVLHVLLIVANHDTVVSTGELAGVLLITDQVGTQLRRHLAYDLVVEA